MFTGVLLYKCVWCRYMYLHNIYVYKGNINLYKFYKMYCTVNIYIYIDICDIAFNNCVHIFVEFIILLGYGGKQGFM